MIIKLLFQRNLEAWRQQNMTEAEVEEMEKREREQKYRDRAKERRTKYGDTETAPPLKIRGLAKAERRKRAADTLEPRFVFSSSQYSLGFCTI